LARKIEIYPTKLELVKAVAEKIAVVINQTVHERGRCAIALSGGSTPRDVYVLLAAESYQKRINWENVYLFWGDERTVPPDHSDSNFNMVREALLRHIAIPETNVYRMRGEITPETAASEYAQLLKEFFGGKWPRFDLILLGVGEDGHTASLFPGTSALHETKKVVSAVFVPKFSTWRITLTLPLFNAARTVMFIMSGGSKSEIARRVVNAQQPDKELPATLIRPENGDLYWMLDADAARAIE
jgi:6-phosphogluconolactonase